MVIRNKTLKPELIQELEWLEEEYFQFDKPIPFKGSLVIYPVITQNYNTFLRTSDCLTLNKNDTTEGILMTHLDFLLNKIENAETGQYWKVKFWKLLEIIFHIENGIRCNQCQKIISVSDFLKKAEQAQETGELKCDDCGSSNFEEVIRYISNSQTNRKELMVNGVKITAKDFERLRQIVMYQNFPDYQDDSWVDPEIREDQRLKQELLAKKGSGGSASLERKIVAIASQTNYKLNEVLELPMRKFIILLGMIDDVITYQADRTGVMSGMVTLKKPLEHWLYKPQKSMYGEAVTQDAYTQQIAKANQG